MSGDRDALVAALSATDAVARGVLADHDMLRFAVARTEEERGAAFRLRNAVAVEAGWIFLDAFPDGRERDDFDAVAHHLVGWDGDLAAAAARLVFPAPGRRLPMEELFEIEVEPRGGFVEIGRLSVHPGYRRPDHLFLIGVIATAWLHIRARGFHVLGGLTSAPMTERLRRIGFRTTVLGPARQHWNEERYPIRFDVLENVPTLRDRDEARSGREPRPARA